MEKFGSTHHVASIDVADGLVAETDTKHRHLAGKSRDGLAQNAGVFGAAGARREKNGVGLEGESVENDSGTGQSDVASTADQKLRLVKTSASSQFNAWGNMTSATQKPSLHSVVRPVKRPQFHTARWPEIAWRDEPLLELAKMSSEEPI